MDVQNYGDNSVTSMDQSLMNNGPNIIHGTSLGDSSGGAGATSFDFADGLPDSIINRAQNNGIKILSWNVNSILARRETIMYAVNTKNYDVILIQEARLTESNHFNFTIPGYRKYIRFADGNRNNYGGLVTLVKEEIASHKIFHPTYGEKFEHLTVHIKTREGILEIQNIYWPNVSTNHKDFNLSQANEKASKLLIAGDFNAHQQQLIRRDTIRYANNNRKAVERILENSDLVLTNPREPTTTFGTLIDLCFTSNNLSPVTDTTITEHLSDIHFALEINLDVARILTEEEFVPRLKFESADWDLFQQRLDEKFEEADLLDNISPDRLDDAASKLAEIYYDTATEVIPKTKFHSKPWQSWYWCPEVARATRKANYWRRAHKKQIIIPNLREKKQQALNEEKEVVLQAKQRSWNKLCKDIILTNNDRKAWVKIKNLRRGGLPPSRPKLVDPTEKAEELARSFAQRTNTMNLTARIRNTMNLLEPNRLREINKALNEPDPEFDKEITNWEIEKSFAKGKDSAPGEDKVTYSMAKNSGPVAKSIAQKIYNISWQTSRVPAQWKIAAQVAIPKPASRDEFRPISLLSVFDKNLERIAHDRMMKKARSKLHPNLYGFLENRGTQDGLLSLSSKASSHIYDRNSCSKVEDNPRGYARKHRNNDRCIAVFVDLEKAFELANKNVILHTLTTLGVKGKLLAWIQNYLSDRKGYVSINGQKSGTHNFENGTPQGSIISPALFNILIHALLSYQWPDNVEVYSYADDLVIISRDVNAVSKIKEALKTLSVACEELGLKINANKTKIMEFGGVPNRDITKEIFTVGLGEDETQIEVVSEFKYLGVIYTSNLKAYKHIDYTVKKANRKINLLKAMSCKELGCDTATLVRYVTTCIRPVLEYGIQYLNAAGIRVRDRTKFEAVLPRALKIAYGLPQTTRNHAVLIEAGLTDMGARTAQASMNTMVKAYRSIDKHPEQWNTHLAFEDSNEYHEQHGRFPIQSRLDVLGPQSRLRWEHQPWLQRTAIQILTDLNLWEMLSTPNPISKFKKPVGAPYSHKVKLTILPLQSNKNSLTEKGLDEARNFFNTIISDLQFNSQITIFTDASVNQETRKATFACAVFINGQFNNQLSTQGRISDHSGSMTTELYAIKQAVKIICFNARQMRIRKFLIVTDSMSGIQALQNTDNPDNRYCVLEIHRRLDMLEKQIQTTGTILWCPSHIGIFGNEKADEMAGAAMGVDHTIIATPAASSAIKSRIKTFVKQQWLRRSVVSNHYAAVNPNKKQFKIPKGNRPLQVHLMRLRHNTDRLCGHRCRTICTYCEVPFSTGHYFISCPANPHKDDLKDLLSPEEHAIEEDHQAALILQRISKSESGQTSLWKMLSKKPPASHCTLHPREPRSSTPWL